MPNFRLIGAAVKPAIRHEQTNRQTDRGYLYIYRYIYIYDNKMVRLGIFTTTPTYYKNHQCKEYKNNKYRIVYLQYEDT